MKKEIVEYVDKCLIYQNVEAMHQRPMGELQPSEIPAWNCDSISINFMMGLPLPASKKNAIWVRANQPTKSAHFRSIWDTWRVKRLA